MPQTIFAQQVQKDKTHHRKIQKISDLGVYLVLLSEFFPGSVGRLRLPHFMAVRVVLTSARELMVNIMPRRPMISELFCFVTPCV